MPEQIDLTICQNCKEAPAVYGDGITWSNCAKCYRLLHQAEQPKVQPPVESKESFPHEIKAGLTSVVLPVYMKDYSLFHYTGNCIGALREHTPEGSYELVIVDNGSPIQPPELTSYYADRVIKNETNLGYTKAMNQGIRMSTGEYIVLLCNDVQVFEGWLEDMKKALDEGMDLVMAHPMYSLTEPFARAVEAKQIREGKKVLDPLPKDFSCVMFKRSLVDEIGLLDEQFFNYCSDSDFMRRMDQVGKKYKVLGTVATSHLSDATGFTMPETPEIMNKDKEAFEKKWANVDPPAPAVPAASSSAAIDPNYRTIRVINGGDPIYLIKDGVSHHIKNPETLQALGFNFGQEQSISREEFKSFTRGDLVNMKNVEELKKA